MKKKVWLVILILVIVALVATGAYIICTNNETKEAGNIVNEPSANMQAEVNSVNTSNEKNDAEKQNVVNETKAEEENKNEAENNANSNNGSEAIEETPKTNEEKAISIVKKDWKNQDGVYFSTMGIDAQGRYIVTVNDSNTTGTLAWYAVNVKTGEFEIQ